ncbi:MAG: hypothetical protein PHZ00_08085, partial [Candidatus Peribacteraceae bacterium]|nr:hypothetical protein [Candidatus Peribacteraceae bacterium]
MTPKHTFSGSGRKNLQRNVMSGLLGLLIVAALVIRVFMVSALETGSGSGAAEGVDLRSATGSVEIETSSGSLEGQVSGSGSGTFNQDDTGTGTMLPASSSGSLEGQVSGSGSGTQNQDETGTGSITPGTSSGSTASGSVSSEATSDPTS